MLFPPAHATSLHATFHHQLVGALHTATANRISLLPKGGIADHGLAFFEVVEASGDRLSGFGPLISLHQQPEPLDLLDHQSRISLLQLLWLPVQPRLQPRFALLSRKSRLPLARLGGLGSFFHLARLVGLGSFLLTDLCQAG